MQNETEIRTRLQHMVAQETFGAEALQLLQVLITFRTPFDEAGWQAVAPRTLSAMTKPAIFLVLCHYQWILPAETPDTFRVNPALYSLLTPAFDAHRSHFAYVTNHSTSEEMEWRQDHWEDVRAALIWGVEHQRDQALRFLRQIRILSDRMEDRSSIRIFLREMIESVTDAQVRGALLYTEAVVARHDQDFDAMYTAFEESVRAYQQAGDLKQQGFTLNRLGQTAQRCGDVRRAYDAHTRELEVGRQYESRQRQRMALRGLVDLSIEQKDWSGAYEYLVQRGSLGRAVDDLDDDDDALHELGLVVGKLGRLSESRHYLAQSYAICDREQLLRQRWLVLWDWGEIELEQGDPDYAAHLWQLALLAIDAWADNAPAYKNMPWDIITEQRVKLAALQEKRHAEGKS